MGKPFGWIRELAQNGLVRQLFTCWKIVSSCFPPEIQCIRVHGQKTKQRKFLNPPPVRHILRDYYVCGLLAYIFLLLILAHPRILWVPPICCGMAIMLVVNSKSAKMKLSACSYRASLAVVRRTAHQSPHSSGSAGLSQQDIAVLAIQTQYKEVSNSVWILPQYVGGAHS